MANPSLPFLPELMAEIEEEYQDWLEHPEQNGDFMTKRMGIRSGVKEISVTEYENIKRTNKPLPDLRGWNCTAGLDYAELSDWAAVNLHFKKGDLRFDINRAWMCINSRDKARIKAPWQDWAEQGKLTIVDEQSIHPDVLTNYIAESMKQYNIKMLALDHHRLALVNESLKKIGFDSNDKSKVKLVRPSDIMQVVPVIEYCFDNDLFTWGITRH